MLALASDRVFSCQRLEGHDGGRHHPQVSAPLSSFAPHAREPWDIDESANLIQEDAGTGPHARGLGPAVSLTAVAASAITFPSVGS